VNNQKAASFLSHPVSRHSAVMLIDVVDTFLILKVAQKLQVYRRRYESRRLPNPKMH